MNRDLYVEVTQKVIESLEQGAPPWIRPWQCTEPHGGMPYNALSGKPYRGINVLMLFNPAFGRSAWLTFKQAKDAGANVRKGEHGSMIVFYKPFEIRDRNAPADGEEHTRTIPLLKCYHVFNLEQIDGLPDKYLPQPVTDRPEIERHAAADALLAKAKIEHGGDQAFFCPSTDSIRLPDQAKFETAAGYYATALHELTHWSGAKSRLAREYGKRYGDSAYAREELVAEMGSAFMCGQVGIQGQLQHPSYIASWLKILGEDKRAIVVAAGAAQKAADYLLDYHVGEESAEQAA